MNYTITGLLVLLVAACRAPTDADDASYLNPSRLPHVTSDITPEAAGLKIPKPSLVTTACVDASNSLVVTETWDNQTIDPTQVLTLTVSLKRPKTGTEVKSEAFRGPFDVQPSFATVVFIQFLGAPWDTFTSIGATASGTFTDVAPALRQPKTGWPTC
jgi:hypothetical protein